MSEEDEVSPLFEDEIGVNKKTTEIARISMISSGEIKLVQSLIVRGFLEKQDLCLLHLLGISESIAQRRKILVEKEILSGIEKWKTAFQQQKKLEVLIKLCEQDPNKTLQPIEMIEEQFGIKLPTENLAFCLNPFAGKILIIAAANYAICKAEKEAATNFISLYVSNALSGTSALEGIDKLLNQVMFGRKKDFSGVTGV